jgi:hypothetical protein
MFGTTTLALEAEVSSALAPGEMTRLSAVIPHAANTHRDILRAICDRSPFTAMIAYADAAAAPRGAVRFEIEADNPDASRWFVRRPSWAGDAEAAKLAPLFTSQVTEGH